MSDDELPINQLTDRILGACVEVHRHLGPGLLETAYERCVAYELDRLGLGCERQVPVRMMYKTLDLPDAYRLDVLVARRVVLEIKAVEQLLPVHASQVITYLRITDLGVGLLVNFHTPSLRGQIRRFVNPTHAIPRVTE